MRRRFRRPVAEHPNFSSVQCLRSAKVSPLFPIQCGISFRNCILGIQRCRCSFGDSAYCVSYIMLYSSILIQTTMPQDSPLFTPISDYTDESAASRYLIWVLSLLLNLIGIGLKGWNACSPIHLKSAQPLHIYETFRILLFSLVSNLPKRSRFFGCYKESAGTKCFRSM